MHTTVAPPTTHSSQCINLKDVHKTYQVAAQEVRALRGVDLQIGRGKLVGVTGKSGAGKSTLLHVIGTLDKPTSGRLILNGTDISIMGDRESSVFRNSTVGFVFQMNNLLHEFTAMENVMMPGMIAGVPGPELRPRAQQLLESVGLAERTDHKPGQLSGGEQQRVAIARALLMAPPILLADEPTGNLDQKTSLAIQELLMDICRRNQVTMLLVTHDLELAARLPHQVVMEDGRVVEGSNLS